MRFSLCENKKDDNVPFDFPFFNERQTKTTQPIEKLFLPIDSWIANYRITKYVLHLDYASKSKNSTEASMSEIRNYSVANPIYLNYFLRFLFFKTTNEETMNEETSKQIKAKMQLPPMASAPINANNSCRNVSRRRGGRLRRLPRRTILQEEILPPENWGSGWADPWRGTIKELCGQRFREAVLSNRRMKTGQDLPRFE